MSEPKEKEENDEFDFDLKDDSWLKNEQEIEKEEKPKVDFSKLDRDLLSKSVLIDYIRERKKNIHILRR